MKTIDTKEYLSVLKELVEQGQQVHLTISGNSMEPFLIHNRDIVFFESPRRDLRKGDIVFYQRKNGQFVMHRIRKVKPDGYYIIGDNQTVMEGPVKKEQIFAIVTKVVRKGKEIKPGDFWWFFFESVWIRIIPLRRIMIRLYGRINGIYIEDKRKR